MMAKRVLIFSIFQKSLKNDPRGSRKDQFKAFLQEIRKNDDLIEQLAEVYFEQNYHRFKTREDANGSVSIVGTPAEERRAETIAARRAERDAEIATMTQERVKRNEALIRKVILLEIKLPNGKKLREATGADCVKAGGFYAEVARYLKPTEVVDKHLNEAELQNIWSRFEKSPKRRGVAIGAERETRIGA